MPMTNAESLDFAFKCYVKSVHAFTQRGPNCTGYVAMWLRKRSRNKPFFRADYFHVEPGESASPVWMSVRLMANSEGARKRRSFYRRS